MILKASYTSVFVYTSIHSNAGTAPLNLLTTKFVLFFKLRFHKQRTCIRHQASFVYFFFFLILSVVFFVFNGQCCFSFRPLLLRVYSLTFITVRNVYAYLFCGYLFITWIVHIELLWNLFMWHFYHCYSFVGALIALLCTAELAV